jgi:nucleotide-binding universal stress UspA family protein
VYKHLLIATDGSELAQKAVDQGFALAKALNAKATVINVTPRWTWGLSSNGTELLGKPATPPHRPADWDLGAAVTLRAQPGLAV